MPYIVYLAMHKEQRIIQVFEYQTLYKAQHYDGVKFEERHFDALLELNELHEGKYFTIVYNGVKFNSYVGVIQIEDLILEILPKIEGKTLEKNKWRDVLIQMLLVTHQLGVHQVGNAQVDKQNIHLLDIYFDWFLSEVNLLLRQGLIKQYHTQTKNTLALKGKIEFAGHIRKNIVHQERFYTTHQIYDQDHLIHQLMALALEIIANLSKGSYRYGTCKATRLNFPDVKAIDADEHVFKRLKKSRKTEPYQTVLALSRLIILNYSPNVKAGAENMLALLFDMNMLWEQYILIKLQQQAKGWIIRGQESKKFWESKSIRPDIVLTNGEDAKFIIDTKWKNYSFDSLSSHDLRQIYVYNDFWDAKVGMLLFPSRHLTKIAVTGIYARNQYIGKIGLVNVLDGDGNLNRNLGEEIINLLL
ncbi:MAG: restriction endonuclease [Pedobacter sp.]|nr:MAG: restriction endonuclease [Pedobacter sp.]